jgi:hypothetical protein
MTSGLVLAWFTLGVFVPAYGGTITYVTPPGATESGGNPVDAAAIFTTSANTLTITLEDLLANPKTVAQLLSDLSFTVGGGGSLTGSSLASSAGQEITVHSDGTFTLGAIVASGWDYTAQTGTSGLLDVLGTPTAPTHLIIGPPGPGGTYSNANNSIAGNGPHNPFLNQSVAFTITGSGITTDTTITSVTFSFGTTSGDDVPGITKNPRGGPVPEPESFVMSLTGIGLMGLFMIYRSRRRNRVVAD